MLFYSRVLQHSSYDCMEDIYVSLPHTLCCKCWAPFLHYVYLRPHISSLLCREY